MRSLAFGLSKTPVTRPIVSASSTAPSVLPHLEQKARLEKSDDLQVDGAPPGPVHLTFSRGNSTQASVGAPEWRWHMVQEQVCGLQAGPFASKRI